MSKLNRRTFLRRGALAGGALAMQGFAARAALDAAGLNAESRGAAGYGPLRPAKAKNTGETFLALPKGFEYNVLGKTGAVMSDGRPTPGKHDGMAAFDVRGELRLVRNHEVNHRAAAAGAAFGARPYDPLAGGGTTTLVIDPRKREVVRDFVSLSGTLVNCAGGPTPWGSWITCEETVLGTARERDAGGAEYGGFARPHGYCFEVSAASDGHVAPEPLRQMGRFVHEAVAVDPQTRIVYETEDRLTAGFYRFVPREPGRLASGGRLQMLAVKGRPRYDARAGQKMGAALEVVWVGIENPDPPEAERDPAAVYKQGLAGGGATFTRLEGCWYGGGRVYFTSTNGGDKGLGQVWEYEPRGDAGLLRLLFESPSEDVLRMPDNLCVSPRGGGLVICEDNGVVHHLRGLTPRGRLFDLARNVAPGLETREFAGATFSPDGQTLFVNIQTPGLTFAIWGPWEQGPL
ncbi:MAG TPA: alkaline phosphatase PhoX [Pyrinomonadaceae bacterium]|nr:alkaline phosphatase PhoX [Pyrinomonadaceae bacterium]